MSALRYSRRAIVGAGALATLAACGTSSSGSSTSKSSTTSTGTTTAGGSAPAPLTLTDGWAKAAETGMTAVFGTLVNNTDKAVTVTTGTCAKSTKVEMHEMVMDAKGVMVMQPIDGGLVVPAKGSKKLEPGANHIMLMGLTAPVVNGETLDLTLTTDGGSVPLSVPIRTFTGGAEPPTRAWRGEKEVGAHFGSWV